MPLAPCVAVIGPANAGKTSLLHQLDEALKKRLDSVLVLKGNPDGTGRYLYHSPDLRNEPNFKALVKGKWGDATVERICEWVTHGRRNLSLALLDFGGRHDEQTAKGNRRMLACCSHYLVVSRDSDPEGAAYWDEIGRAQGLTRVGWMRSVRPDGALPEVRPASRLEATFRIEVAPSDCINDEVLAPLVEALVAISHPADRTPYVNLHRAEDWRIEQIPDVGGQAEKIAELASRTGVVVLGGAAPVWAYLAGLRCATNSRPDVRVFFYDPRQPERLVEIPAKLDAALAPSKFPEGELQLAWEPGAEAAVLRFEIVARDKFLSPAAAQNLAGAPEPTPLPRPDAALTGAAPLWLFGAYARWMGQAGARSLSSWDGRTKRYVRIWG